MVRLIKLLIESVKKKNILLWETFSIVIYLTNFGLKIPLPGCPLLHYLGIPCPGWGLTRSFQAIADLT